MNRPIIKAKLQPAVIDHALLRERLIADFRENVSKRLHLIVSYDGSGKTTLTAQFIQSEALDSVWYNLDSYDQDPGIFSHYITTAIQTHYPNFCQDLQPQSLLSLNSWPRFIQELQKEILRPFFIVLDNYECIRGAKLINQFLIYLLQHLPQTVHLIILTNQLPRFSLTRYRLEDDLYLLKADDLAFTLHEAQRLLDNVFQLSVPKYIVKQIVQETEGWALALILFAQNASIRRASHEDCSLEFKERYKEDLHEYFLGEILKSYPENTQELLLSSAFLPFISPNELREYLGPGNAGVLLKCITKSNIPIFPLNDGTETYRYHNLFRDFLLEKIRDQKSESEIAKLHFKAAISLEKNHPVEAIDHYLAANMVEEAVTKLVKLGWRLLREGRYETLKLLLNRIPPEARSQNPILFYYSGRIREIHGDIEEAQRYYQEALDRLGDDVLSVTAACKERLGILELKKDRFKHARKIFVKTLNQLEQSEIQKDIIKRLIATHANLAKVYCKLEEENKTRNHLKKAQALIDLYGEPSDDIILLQAVTLESVVKGDFDEAIHLGTNGKRLCQKSRLEGLLPIFDHYLAFAHLYLGTFNEARGLAKEGLSILENQDVEDNIYGALLSDMGHCQMAMGQIQEGIQSLSESSRIFKKNQNFCGQFWNDSAMCLLKARQGDLSKAWEHWRMMERNSCQLSLPMQHVMTLVTDAHLSALEQASDKTLEKLAEARPLLKRSQQKMSVFHALVLAIKSCLTIGRNDLAEETFLRAASMGDLRKYYYTVHYEREWFLPLAEGVIRRHPHLKPFLARSLPSRESSGPNGSRSTEPQISVASISPQEDLLDLHIYALGAFRIVARGWEVPLEQCPSKKALTLMKYLFFKRHERGISLDEALELLWPEMDPQATRSNLRVILSMFRKVFKRQGNGANAFPNLIRDGSKLKLALGQRGWTDVDEFLDQIKLAEYKEKRNLWAEAVTHYQKMLELYKGDFLSDEPYADWCYMEREYLRDQYLSGLMRMAECHQRLGKPSEAISILYQLLRIDMYREDAYQRLMALCSVAGRKGEMMRAYKLCEKAIEKDLNLKLSSDTRDLYRRLSNSLEGAQDQVVREMRNI